MAKIRQNNFLDTVDEVFTSAKKAGVLHLYSDGDSFSGRTIQIKGKSHFHFGTTGYLGLEQDSRLKSAAMEAIEKYGTQFPLSKSYISHPLYAELEARVGEIYNQPVVITKNSTLGHLAVIPAAVRDQDGVILDHQVHWSVQNATQLLKLRSVPVEMIRHNNLEMLEDKIRKLSGKCKKIWYMADGVYSMYGDYAPTLKLMELSRKYPQLHFYFDDVHGMSWNGKRGGGYINSILGDKLPENVLLIGTLSKTFGASGAVAVCSDKKLHSRIKTFGGPLTFSAQLEPASVGAAIASANIHLSSEISLLQEELQERISYFNELLENTDLPLIDRNNSPVFYIGTGMPVSGYKFVHRLINEGFYVNLGIYPAVPVKNTGVRITISRHNTLSDIKALVAAMEYHYPKALEETGTSLTKVRRAFKLSVNEAQEAPAKSHGLELQLEEGIANLDQQEWNSFFSGKGILDWEGQLFLEEVFSNNPSREHNWKFFYFIIRDKNKIPVLAAPVCQALWKDDLLAPVGTSQKVEAQRKEQGKFYLTSEVLSLGSLFTEGEHLYLNEAHPDRNEALNLFLDKLEELGHRRKTSMIVLRDFHCDTPLNNVFHDRGFVRVHMPDSCTFGNFDWSTREEFGKMLSKRSRRHFQKEVLAFEPYFHAEVFPRVTDPVLDLFRKLFEKVKENNLGLNTFDFPVSAFRKMNEHPNWEFLVLSVRKEYSEKGEKEIVGVMFCYMNGHTTYVPSFVGMDYHYSRKYHIYRQLLWQTILRARERKVDRIDFGLTAAFEKRKLGAEVFQKICYVQANDNFSLELLETMQHNQ